jgi:hypothetical protein
MYTLGSNVRMLSERDGGAVDESQFAENDEPLRKNGSFNESAFDKLFSEAADRFGITDDGEPERPKESKQKSLDEALDEKLTEHYAEQEDRESFASPKGLEARESLVSHWGDAGNFGNIIDSFLQIARDFKAEPLMGAEKFVRHFQANKFRADRAEQLGVDRTIPADAPRWQKLDRHIAQAAELTARDDSLTKKQINELRQLFPGTPIAGILANSLKRFQSKHVLCVVYRPRLEPLKERLTK